MSRPRQDPLSRRRRRGVSVAGQPAGKMMYRLVREMAADGIPVTVTCRVLKIARRPDYRWLAKPVTAAELRAAYRANALFDAHCDDPEFGNRFLLDEARVAGEPMAERTAWRICSELGWWSAFGKKRGKNGKRPGPPVQGPARVHRRRPEPVVAGRRSLEPKQGKASSMSARSTTSTPTASWAARSTHG